MTPADETTASTLCAQCGGSLDLRELACLSCGTLVHAAELERLASEAVAAQSRGDLASARKSWVAALGLLPASALQYRSIDQRIQQIDAILKKPTDAQAKAPMGKWLSRLGPVGVALWKAKYIGLLILTKGKLVLLGLTKLSTLASMGVSFLFYWHFYGWRFGLGLVLSIFIHEMGHVLELRKFGIAATAPMFIPGFGAFIQLKQRPATAAQDARTGLAYPIYGLAAAVIAYLLYLLTGEPLWGALARFGAWINLFNLIPIWQLDGGRGFAALTRSHRGMILALTVVLWFWTSDNILALVALGAAYRMFTKDAPSTPDPPVLYRYAALLAALAWLCTVGAGPQSLEQPSKATGVASITSVSPASNTAPGIARSLSATP